MSKARWIHAVKTEDGHKHDFKIAGRSLTNPKVLVYTCRLCPLFFGMKTNEFYPALKAKTKKSNRVRRSMSVIYGPGHIPKHFNKKERV